MRTFPFWITLFALALVVSRHSQGALPVVTWQSARLGNIFELGEKIEITAQVPADSADYEITDFWHNQVEVGSGTFPVGKLDIHLDDDAEPGYYLIHVTPKKDGAQFADAYTSFAIVRPHETKDPVASPFGVMTHFAQGMNPEILPLFKKIGIESIRDEHYWGSVEKTKGVYEFSPKSDTYMKACAEVGIQPLVAMTFGNKLYDGEKGPSTPSGYAGYGKYGQAILEHYGKQIHALEIWNEYNGSWFPDAAKNDRPKYYTEMLKAAYTDIKAVRPDVQVLGGAAVLIPLPYFKGLFQNGALQSMDAVVIHPYRGSPEGVDREVGELQELIRQFNNGKDKPIWATESGKQSMEEYPWEEGRKMYEKGRADGARYLAKQYTLLLKQKVAKAFWYLAADHGTFIGMGLLRHHQSEPSGMGRLAVTPSYVSYANLIEQLAGAEFVREETLREYSRARVYLFQRGGEEVRVCWALQPTKVHVKAGKEPFSIINLMGGKTDVKPRDGEFEMTLGEDAIYIRGKLGGLTEMDTGSRVIASATDDYSKTQGTTGWYYGTLDAAGAFQELKQVETMWGYAWGGNFQNLKISHGSMHPDKVGGVDRPAILRWKSTVDGKLNITGSWTNNGGKGGDGITGAITVDGKEISTQQVGGTSPKRVEIAVPIEVKKGSLVDFVCRPNTNVNFDSTGFTFLINQETLKR